jgi:hypothetical protein
LLYAWRQKLDAITLVDDEQFERGEIAQSVRQCCYVVAHINLQGLKGCEVLHAQWQAHQIRTYRDFQLLEGREVVK